MIRALHSPLRQPRSISSGSARDIQDVWKNSYSDENKPTGSIRIRVETINYFLKRYREDMIANKGKEKTIEEK